MCKFCIAALVGTAAATRFRRRTRSERTGPAAGVFRPPQLQFHGGAARRFAEMGATGSLLTITHSQELAIAHVLLVRA